MADGNGPTQFTPADVFNVMRRERIRVALHYRSKVQKLRAELANHNAAVARCNPRPFHPGCCPACVERDE